MLAFLILIFAACSRLMPHVLHGVGLNFTAVAGGLLFFGARRPRWQAVIAAAMMALTDVYLTVVVYGMKFHLADYALTWAWYAAVCLIGSGLLRRVTAVRMGIAVVCSASGFFLLSNSIVWLTSGMYPHSGAGLVACFVAALPFYGNDLVSTGITAGVLFGLPVVAGELVSAWKQGAWRGQALP